MASIYNSDVLNNVFQTESTLARGNFNNARNATNTNVIPKQGFNQKILNVNCN